jgi:hypothetical protein
MTSPIPISTRRRVVAALNAFGFWCSVMAWCGVAVICGAYAIVEQSS